jgi:hypothetical protein
MQNKKIYILAIFLAVVLTGCSLSLAKKQNAPEIKKEPAVNNIVATSSDNNQNVYTYSGADAALIAQQIASDTTESNKPFSENDISTWKTFSSKALGIEFKYPSPWPNLVNDSRSDRDTNFKYSSIYLGNFSSFHHTFPEYDNLSMDEQFKKIQCSTSSPNYLFIKCEDRVSPNGVKYVFWEGKTLEGHDYGAFVATGKYMLAFQFDDAVSYEKRADEYQKLFSSMKAIK